MIRLPRLSVIQNRAFPEVETALLEPNGLLCAGGDLSPDRLLLAYRSGIFPWYSEGDPILWWSPDPRMVFDTDDLKPNMRMRRWMRQRPWQVTANRAFSRVMRACAAPRDGQQGTWIMPEMIQAYERLHHLGHAHSVEVWEGKPFESSLIGGIYGIGIGRMFFGESMFSTTSNASKAAIWSLAQGLRDLNCPLLDGQVESPHLQNLGAKLVPRKQFIAQLSQLCEGLSLHGVWKSQWPKPSTFPVQYAAQLDEV